MVKSITGMRKRTGNARGLTVKKHVLHIFKTKFRPKLKARKGEH
jgi:hypothetical protein